MATRLATTMLRLGCLLLLFGLSSVSSASETGTPDPRDLIRAAMEHWRGVTSYSEMTMVIHRSDWERSFSMQAWTEGDKLSLVRVTEPKRDAGNGTLVKDQNMWTFSPKINRILKVPSSMMNQSWMGSDFSNKDISRTDEIVEQYEHNLLGETESDGFPVYEIESLPHEEAAVVWGREVLKIRADNVMIEHRFYDQDDVLVKTLRTLEIREMGGRNVAARQRMEKEEFPDEWTEIVMESVEFDIELGDNVFTLSNLRNPRN